MSRIWKWYNKLSYRIRKSITISASFIGIVATLLTILGFSLKDITENGWQRLLGLIVLFIIVYVITNSIIRNTYKSSVSLKIHSMPVVIAVGDLFQAAGYKVIGCDTHFDTRVDDVVISKTSLHGQLILEHGDMDDIKAAVEKTAQELDLQKNEEGLYDFPLGTIVSYESNKDKQTYLMVAMTEIRRVNGHYKAYSSMQNYESMLHKMWEEIDGVYAGNDIVLPLLGGGITRFEAGSKERNALLKCMLCTLYSSGIVFNAKITILLFGNVEDIPLYDYKELFNSFNIGDKNV